jgi:hypothetical protein
MALESTNLFGVGVQAEHVTILAGWRLRMPITRDAALNLAAWLLALADAPLAFEHVSVTTDVDEPDRRSVTAVLSAEFIELLGKVQQS